MTEPHDHPDLPARPAPADAPGTSPSTAGRAPESAATSRRTFLRRGLIAGGALAAGGGALAALTAGDHDRPAPTAPSTGRGVPAVARSGEGVQPNILVIVVDQMRTPAWFPASAALDRMLPNLAGLRRESVSFAHHYTASNDCTPARATLLTGLHTHQTGAMITGGSTLDPSFPTYGTMLREHGYDTNWYGKWHLTHGDHRWTPEDAGALEVYGFGGGTFPSPDGGPGQGWRVDPIVATQFADWFARSGGRGPWCTTVSFVNPHDVAWWYGWSDRTATEFSAPRRFGRLPANFETPEISIERRKPRLQRALMETAAASFGPVPFHGPGMAEKWLPLLDLYLKLQRNVDQHIGRVLDTLAGRPEVAANTIVLFTSDHGEYGSSHGLRGKGAGAYEEAIRVPLMIKDPRGKLTRETHRPRTQLSSSVDIVALLLTIARGSGAWRQESHYAHLAARPDLSAALADPSAPGRSYVLHATDEIVTEYAVSAYAASAPLHVTAVRTPTAKYVTYSHWQPGTTVPQAGDQDRELYDYATRAGRLELDNAAGRSALEEPMHALLERALAEELHESLPGHLRTAQQRGYRDYDFVNGHAASAALLRRARRAATGRIPDRPGPAAPFGALGPQRPLNPSRRNPSPRATARAPQALDSATRHRRR